MSAEMKALKAIMAANEVGLGPVAFDMYQRALTGRIRPLLQRQKARLENWVALQELEPGLPPDEEALKLEAEIEAEYEKVLDQITTVFLEREASA